MTTITILQPAYLPWLGYFDRIAKADAVVFLDHVPMDRNTKTKFTNRNRVWSPNGAVWLTVPIQSSGASRDTPIAELRVAENVDWHRKHMTTLQRTYSRAPYFDLHRDALGDVLTPGKPRLVDYVNPLTHYLMEAFGIDRRVHYSSDMPTTRRKSDLILEICSLLGARRYLSGPFGRDYLDRERFRSEGIDLLFHDYAHPVYPQRGTEFVPYLSAVDLLFNCGPEARGLLLSCEDTLSRD